jgi:hypothetical protein
MAAYVKQGRRDEGVVGEREPECRQAGEKQGNAKFGRYRRKPKHGANASGDRHDGREPVIISIDQ